MRNFIRQILRLIPTADRLARLIHARLSGIIFVIAFYLLAIGPILNILGMRGLNLIPLFILALGYTIAFLHPRTLAAIILWITAIKLDGAKLNQAKKEEIIKNLSDILPKLFGEILIWPIALLLYLSLFSFSGNPSAIWVIYGAMIFIAIYCIRYQEGGKFFKITTLVVAYAYIIFCVISLIPDHYQIKYFGAPLTQYLTTTPAEEALSETEEAVEKAENEAVEKKLAEIAKRAKAGQLTQEDIDYLKERKKERDERIIPKKVTFTIGTAVEGIADNMRNIKLPEIQWQTPTKPEILQPMPEATVQSPAAYPEPMVVPHWEEVVRKYVELNKYDAIDGGFVTVAEVPAENEKYLIEIETSDFQQYFIKDGKDHWQAVSPNGITGLSFTYYEKLPLWGTPNNRVGARILKIGDGNTEYLGRRKEISLNQPGTVEIKLSTNMMQFVTEGSYPVANNFINNKGGDWVVVKRWVVS